MKTKYIVLGSILVFVHLLILFTYIAGGKFVFGLHTDWIFLGLSLELPILFVIYFSFADRINDRIIKSFKMLRHNKLFYISRTLTIVATIFFILLLAVQYGDGFITSSSRYHYIGDAIRIGKSTRDGFVLYSFFLIYLAPSISWLIYYLATSKWLTDFIKAQKFKSYEKNQAAKKGVKKSEAIKEIKEAKELLDLGVITQAEYDELAEKLKPIILETKQ